MIGRMRMGFAKRNSVLILALGLASGAFAKNIVLPNEQTQKNFCGGDSPYATSCPLGTACVDSWCQRLSPMSHSTGQTFSAQACDSNIPFLAYCGDGQMCINSVCRVCCGIHVSIEMTSVSSQRISDHDSTAYWKYVAYPEKGYACTKEQMQDLLNHLHVNSPLSWVTVMSANPTDDTQDCIRPDF